MPSVVSRRMDRLGFVRQRSGVKRRKEADSGDGMEEGNKGRLAHQMWLDYCHYFRQARKSSLGMSTVSGIVSLDGIHLADP